MNKQFQVKVAPIEVPPPTAIVGRELSSSVRKAIERKKNELRREKIEVIEISKS